MGFCIVWMRLERVKGKGKRGNKIENDRGMNSSEYDRVINVNAT